MRRIRNFLVLGVALAVQSQRSADAQTAAAWQLPSANYVSNLVNDATYGESGKQGSLIFNGGQQKVQGDLKSGPGNADFSLYVRAYVPKTVQASTRAALLTIDAGFWIYLDTSTDELKAEIGVSSSVSSNYRGMKTGSFVATYGGRIVDVLVVRNAAAPGCAIYINGNAVSTTEYTGGTPPAWDADVTGPTLTIGAPGGVSPLLGWSGRVLAVSVFNRALSASEAVQLSFQGVGRDQLGRFRERIKSAGINGFFTKSGNWGAAASGVVVWDGVNFELDVTAASNGDGASLSSGQIHALNIGRLHRVQLDIRNDSGGTTKTVAWGAQTLGTCTGNGTFWYEFTPTVASANLNVTASGAGSFSLANVRLVEMASYEGGRNGAAYSADWSAGADSWTTTSGTLTGNIDAIGGVNDTLRFYASSAAGAHSFKRTFSGATFIGRAPGRLLLSVYIPSANTHVKGVGLSIGGLLWNVIPLAYDTWIPVQMDLASGLVKDTLEIFEEIATTDVSFTGAGVITDDLVYVSGLTIQELGQTRALGNGSFEEAGHNYTGTGDNQSGDSSTFTWWVEAKNGSTTLTRDTTVALAGGMSNVKASCKIVVDGSNSAGSVTASMVTIPGRRYRLKYYAKADSITGTPTLQAVNGTTAISTNTLTTTFAQAVVDFTAVNVDITLTTASGCAGRTVWIDAVEMEERGPVTDLNCGVGVGYLIPDRLSNGADGVIQANYGNEIRHARPAQRAFVRGLTSTSGNQQLKGATILPSNGRITSIAVTSDGSATVNIGSVSAGSDIASGVSVVAGRNEVTLASRYSPTGDVWVNANSTANLTWTINYEIVEP